MLICSLSLVAYAQKFKAAAEAGDPEAQLRMGYYFQRLGKGKTAMEWYLKAANNGNAEAMCEIGKKYYKGFRQYDFGVYQSNKTAVEWFRKAADKGNVEGMEYLGDCFFMGRGIKQNFKEAFAWKLKAAEKGHIPCMKSVSNFYREGIGVMENQQKAEEWKRKAEESERKAEEAKKKEIENAAVSDDANKIRSLAYSVEDDNPQLAKELFAKSVEILQRDIEEGDVSAIITLGYAYMGGSGVSKEPNKAIELFKEAAEKGALMALDQLGRYYITGNGVEQNVQIALDYFNKAYEEGLYSTGSLNDFAENFYNGWGMDSEEVDAEVKWIFDDVLNDGFKQKAKIYTEEGLKWVILSKPSSVSEKVSEKAYKGLMNNPIWKYPQIREVSNEWTLRYVSDLLDRTKNEDDGDAEFSLAFFYEHGKLGTKDMQKYFEWLSQSVAKGDSYSALCLADVYNEGEIVEKNPQKAFEWYSKAVELGEYDAYYRLGLAYKNGDGVAKNLQKALECFTKGAERGSDFWGFYCKEELKGLKLLVAEDNKRQEMINKYGKANVESLEKCILLKGMPLNLLIECPFVNVYERSEWNNGSWGAYEVSVYYNQQMVNNGSSYTGVGTDRYIVWTSNGKIVQFKKR